MGTFYNTKIVTDGLVLGVDFANTKSYNPNSTNYTWYNPDTTRVSSSSLLVSNNTSSSRFGFGPNDRSQWDPIYDTEIGIGQDKDTSSVIVGDHIFCDFSASSNGTLLAKITSLDGTNGGQEVFGIEVVESTGNMTSLVSLSGETCTFTIYPGVPGTNNLISSALPGVIKGGATYSNTNGGIFSFDGTDDEIVVGDTGHTGLASLFAFINQDGTQGSYDGIVYNRGTGSNVAGLSANGQGGNLSYTWANTSSTYNANTGLSIPNSTYCMIGMSVDSSKADIYVNLSKFTNSVSHSSISIDDLKIGSDDFGSRYFKGNIAFVLMYNRYITELEVKQNFEALRGRFGL